MTKPKNIMFVLAVAYQNGGAAVQITSCDFVASSVKDIEDETVKFKKEIEDGGGVCLNAVVHTITRPYFDEQVVGAHIKYEFAGIINKLATFVLDGEGVEDARAYANEAILRVAPYLGLNE